MAKEAKIESVSAQKQMGWAVKLPLVIIGIVMGLMIISFIEPSFLPGLKNIFGGSSLGGSDPFVGQWNTVSPATYYAKDIDGERYVEYKANFHLTITKENKGYLGSGWIDSVTQKAIPGAVVSVPPLIQNSGGGYASPLAFDARGYLDPQPGISSMQLSDDKKTMTITTPLSGGSEKIVLRLGEDKRTMYASLSVVPTSSGSAMGEETDTDILLYLLS